MCRRLRRVARISAAVVFASCPVRAQLQLLSDPDSEWESVVSSGTDPGSTPSTPIGPTTSEGGFSAPERVIFGEQMREHVLDQLCRSINLRYSYNLPGDFGGTGGHVRRYLAPLPDGRLTIVDEERLSVGYGHSFSKAFPEAAGAAVGLWLGARVEGGSMVIRPLQGKATCKELDTLLDLRDVKLVLPFKAERVSAMRVGELWRIPYLLTVGHSESVSATLPEGLGVSLSFGSTESGASTLTIFRLSESELRFRFRIDRVQVRSSGGQVVETIPAVQFALAGVKAAAEIVDQRIADKLEGRKYAKMGAKELLDPIEHDILSQLSRYATASLGLSNSRMKGKRLLLEYIVDPRDPAQAEAVAQALHGDFASLAKMAWRMGTHLATDENTEAAYLRMKALHDAQLGAASYAAINSYEQRARSIALNLPFLTSQSWAKLKGDDTMTRYTGEESEYRIVRADKSRASEYVNVPYVGPLFKDNVQRDVQVVTEAKAAQAYGDPIVVYLQQHGFLHATESSVREKAMQFSEIMALAGTHGDGPNPRLALPLAKAFPAPPAPEPSEDSEDDVYAGSENPNRKGSISFTLVFNQEAVKQLAAATAEEIIKAYAAVAENQPAMGWLLANGKIGADGKMAYDEQTARRHFPGTDELMCSEEVRALASLAKEAAGLVADLLEVRNAADNEVRSVALSKAFGGLGKSGLSYDRALCVFIQLVDPMNLTGDFVAAVNRPRKEPDLALHYVLKKDRLENALLRDAGEAKSRFAEPSILTD